MVISGGDAIADDIPAGSDYYIIQPTSTADFAAVPIPADFFGPGSDPFDGIVCIGGSMTADRTNGGTFSGSPLETTVQVEIIALSLVSCDPVTISFEGGDHFELWDLRVELPGPGPDFDNAAGAMTVTKDHANGGYFDSTFHVQPVFVFSKVDNPQDVRTYNYYDNNDPAFDLDSTGDDWSDQCPDGIPPSSSNFYPGGWPGDPSLPPQTILLSGGPLQLNLVLAPEPATLVLMTLGVAALGAVHRRRRRR